MDQVRGSAGTRARWPLAAAVAVLAAVNLLNNVVAPGWYVVWACAGMLGLVFLARADGLQPADWGAGRLTRRAAVAAVAGALAAAAVLLIGVVIVPDAFADSRVADLSGPQLAAAAAVRAPIGTAALEEVAFRGVLLAMLAARMRLGRAVAVSSAAFGLWHVAPGLGLAGGNAAVGAVVGGSTVGALLFAVAGAALGGAGLCLLRIRYDHLVVPVAVHATLTSLGYVLAWLMLPG